MKRVRWIDRLERRTVVAHLVGGASIRGVLMGTYRDCIVLAHATHLGVMDGARVDAPIDGEAVILRAHVSWLQTLGDQA